MTNKYSLIEEGTGVFEIAFIIKQLNRISLSKTLLILPLITDLELYNFLKKKNSKIRSIEELMIKKPRCFINFNKRYYSTLISSVNSIIMLQKLNIVKIQHNEIIHLKNLEINLDESEFSNRIKDLFQISHNLIPIFKEEISKLYLNLRVII